MLIILIYNVITQNNTLRDIKPFDKLSLLKVDNTVLAQKSLSF